MSVSNGLKTGLQYIGHVCFSCVGRSIPARLDDWLTTFSRFGPRDEVGFFHVAKAGISRSLFLSWAPSAVALELGGGGKCSVYQILQRMQVTKIDGDLASIGWSEQIDVYVRCSAHPYRCASKLTGSCTGSCLAVWHKLIQARV